jgi:hypothetical protein
METHQGFTRRVWFFVCLLLAVTTSCSHDVRVDTQDNSPPPTPMESMSPVALSSVVSIEMGYPCGLEVASRSAWVLSCNGTLHRVSKATGAVTEHRRAVQVAALDPMIGAGESLWLLLARRSGKDRVGWIEELDAASGKTRWTYQLGKAAPSDAKLIGDVIWVAMLDGRMLAIESGAVREVAPRGEPLTSIAGDEKWIWTVDEDADVVQRDIRDGRVLRTLRNVAPSVLSAESVAGSLWAALGDGGVISIDGESGVVTRLDVQGSANHIEPCGSSIWVSQQILGDGPLLTRTGLRALDVDGNVVQTIELDAGPAHLACDGSRLWVASDDSSLGSISI